MDASDLYRNEIKSRELVKELLNKAISDAIKKDDLVAVSYLTIFYSQNRDLLIKAYEKL